MMQSSVRLAANGVDGGNTSTNKHPFDSRGLLRGLSCTECWSLSSREADAVVVPLQNDGSVIRVRDYLRQHFNFRYDLLGVAVAVLCAYIAIYG